MSSEYAEWSPPDYEISLSYITGLPDPSYISNPELRLTFKSLLKRDATTKEKALEKTTALLDPLSKETVLQDSHLLQCWSQIYPKLAIDNSRNVRILSHELQAALCRKIGKEFTPYLAYTVGPWLLGTHDSDRLVTRSASAALRLCFPTPEKQKALFKAFQRKLFPFIVACLRESPDSLSDDRVEPSHDRAAKASRLHAAALELLTDLLAFHSANPAEFSADTPHYAFLFGDTSSGADAADSPLWPLFKSPDSAVLRALLTLFRLLLKTPLAEHFARDKLLHGLFRHAVKRPGLPQAAFFDLLAALPETWQSRKKSPARIDALVTLISQGSAGRATDYWPRLARLLQTVPSELLTERLVDAVARAADSGGSAPARREESEVAAREFLRLLAGPFRRFVTAKRVIPVARRLLPRADAEVLADLRTAFSGAAESAESTEMAGEGCDALELMAEEQPSVRLGVVRLLAQLGGVAQLRRISEAVAAQEALTEADLDVLVEISTVLGAGNGLKTDIPSSDSHSDSRSDIPAASEELPDAVASLSLDSASTAASAPASASASARSLPISALADKLSPLTPATAAKLLAIDGSATAISALMPHADAETVLFLLSHLPPGHPELEAELHTRLASEFPSASLEAQRAIIRATVLSEAQLCPLLAGTDWAVFEPTEPASMTAFRCFIRSGAADAALEGALTSGGIPEALLAELRQDAELADRMAAAASRLLAGSSQLTPEAARRLYEATGRQVSWKDAGFAVGLHVAQSQRLVTSFGELLVAEADSGAEHRNLNIYVYALAGGAADALTAAVAAEVCGDVETEEAETEAETEGTEGTEGAEAEVTINTIDVERLQKLITEALQLFPVPSVADIINLVQSEPLFTGISSTSYYLSRGVAQLLRKAVAAKQVAELNVDFTVAQWRQLVEQRPFAVLALIRGLGGLGLPTFSLLQSFLTGEVGNFTSDLPAWTLLAAAVRAAPTQLEQLRVQRLAMQIERAGRAPDAFDDSAWAGRAEAMELSAELLTVGRIGTGVAVALLEDAVALLEAEEATIDPRNPVNPVEFVLESMTLRLYLNVRAVVNSSTGQNSSKTIESAEEDEETALRVAEIETAVLALLQRAPGRASAGLRGTAGYLELVAGLLRRAGPAAATSLPFATLVEFFQSARMPLARTGYALLRLRVAAAEGDRLVAFELDRKTAQTGEDAEFEEESDENGTDGKEAAIISSSASSDTTAYAIPDDLLRLAAAPPQFLHVDEETGDTAEASELLPSHVAVFRYLWAWVLVLDHFRNASFAQQKFYLDSLSVSDSIPAFLGFFFAKHRTLSRTVKNLDAEDLSAIFHYTRGTGSGLAVYAPEDEVAVLCLNVYFRLLRAAGAEAARWYADLRDRQLAAAVDKFTEAYVAPGLIQEELERVAQYFSSAEASEDDFDVKVLKTAREIKAVYTVDEQKLEMAFRLPANYPLKPLIVEGRQRVGVTENQWKAWILASRRLVAAPGGSIVEAVSLFRRNVSLHVSGVEECAICYAIIAQDRSLPTKSCPTCKNKFHASCLLKWFKSSGANTCPLCRQPFSFKMSRVYARPQTEAV